MRNLSFEGLHDPSDGSSPKVAGVTPSLHVFSNDPQIMEQRRSTFTLPISVPDPQGSLTLKNSCYFMLSSFGIVCQAVVSNLNLLCAWKKSAHNPSSLFPSILCLFACLFVCVFVFFKLVTELSVLACCCKGECTHWGILWQLVSQGRLFIGFTELELVIEWSYQGSVRIYKPV